MRRRSRTASSATLPHCYQQHFRHAQRNLTTDHHVSVLAGYRKENISLIHGFLLWYMKDSQFKAMPFVPETAFASHPLLTVLPRLRGPATTLTCVLCRISSTLTERCPRTSHLIRNDRITHKESQGPRVSTPRYSAEDSAHVSTRQRGKCGRKETPAREHNHHLTPI